MHRVMLLIRRVDLRQRAVEQYLPQGLERAVPVDIAIEYRAVNTEERRHLFALARRVGHHGHGEAGLGWRGLAGAPADTAACPGGDKPSPGTFNDEIAFVLGKRGKDAKDQFCPSPWWYQCWRPVQ